MCGIVGYIGEREALPILLGSLKLVTYRGYDSFGVSILNGEGIETQKSIGAVDQSAREIDSIHGTAGIGHTRWATVGSVSDPNAHPHEDCSGQLAIVHNGDIENYRELRAELEAQGHVFRSETDSEVVAHLIESYYEAGNIVASVRRATQRLVGSYALVVLHRPTRCIVVARQQSPLVVGLGESEAFVASDVPALLPYTHKVIYLADGDIGLLGKGGLSVWHESQKVDRPVHDVEWDAEQLDKGGYDHFMLKEIHQQADAVRHTLAACGSGPESSRRLADLIPERSPDEVLLLGCGTSFHAALLGEYLLSSLLQVPVRAMVASEYYGATQARGKGLAIALTQSGETADTITAVSRAQKADYSVLAITNVPESSISRLAESTFVTKAGPEIAVAATKTFLAQLVALHMLAEQLKPDRDAQGESALRKLPGAVEQTLLLDEEAASAGRSLAAYDRLFIIAKGANVPVAMEGALKFKEVAYLHTEGCPAGELKHGPFALLGPDTPVIAIVPSDGDRPRVLNAMREIAARGSKLVAITDEHDAEAAQLCESVLHLPKAPNRELQAVLNTIALQLLSYYCALERGCPIDRPRNLAKSVTVL